MCAFRKCAARWVWAVCLGATSCAGPMMALNEPQGSSLTSGGAQPGSPGASGTLSCEELCARMPDYTQKCAGVREAPPDCLAGCGMLPARVNACVQAMDCSQGCMTCVEEASVEACGAPPGAAPAPAAQVAITWAGTWNVQVNYEADCDVGMGNMARGAQDFTVAVVLSGPNDTLEANATGYVMRGTGGGAGLTLSGQFPIRDHKGNVAANVTKNNNVTLKITQLTSTQSASGVIEGAFNGNFGFKCKVKNGQVALTR